MMLPVKTITEHAHNLYRMSSNLRSIAYCPGNKNYRRQNKMTFSPELYIVALKKWMVYVLYIFNLYISEIFRKLKIMILAFHITLNSRITETLIEKVFKSNKQNYYQTKQMLSHCIIDTKTSALSGWVLFLFKQEI
jgi:hypothetical protein